MPEFINEDGLPADYEFRVERVCSEAAEELRLCRGDLLAQLRVCCSYFERGKADGITHGELLDFLGISAPSVLDRAGYSDLEAERLIASFVLIREDENGKLQRPTSLPSESPSAPATQGDLGLK